MKSSLSVAPFILGFTLAACADDGGKGTQLGQAPQIEVSESGRTIPSGGAITVSSSAPANLIVGNTGTAPLQLRSLEIESNPPGAFAAVSVPMPGDTPILITPEGGGHPLQVTFDATAAAGVTRPSARLVLRTNGNLDGTTEFVLNVNPILTAGRLVVQPSTLDMGSVASGQVVIKQVALLNTGAAPVAIRGMFLSGHPGYSVDIAGTVHGVTAESVSDGITFDSPVVIPAGETRPIDILYRALGSEQADGQVVFLSDDPQAPDGTILTMFANANSPCIRVTPTRVDFGAKRVGETASIDVQIESCGAGEGELVIDSIEIVDDPSGVFDVDASVLGTFPLTLTLGEVVTLPVQYLAASVAQLDGSGQFIRDAGLLRVSSNAFIADFDVPLSGFGTDGSCPVAVIDVAQGDEVIPQTRLTISASNSTASSGVVSRWQWRVVQPTGSASVILPSTQSENISFEANIVGEYVFYLKVWDSFGTESCVEAERRVFVTSTEDIRVELLWDNPSDSNQVDFDGADVDLHFVHPNGINGSTGRPNWYSSPWDVYYANPRPRWSTSNTRANPTLDRDDVDGAGPENLNLDVAEFGLTYHVGVHYYDDWTYGESYVTVRVYIRGALREQWNRVRMVELDMWDCCTISWPSATITRKHPAGQSGDVPLIVPNTPRF